MNDNVILHPSAQPLRTPIGHAMRTGESAWFLPVTGLALGTTTVTLSSAGLPAQSVVVQVVAAQVTVLDGALKVTGLSPTTAGTLVQDVRSELQTSMAGGDQRIDHIARRLGMSGRTLQRHLADNGLTYASIVDEVRLETAKIALADLSMSLSHVAYFVGFEEQSSFSRAFKRWTSTSPKDYRDALRSPASRSRSTDTSIS